MENWQNEFRNRMSKFGSRNEPQQGAIPISIKVHVKSGCFHRQHSPHAYEIIDQNLREIHDFEEFEFEEHESGPELLVYVTLATLGIGLAKSIIDLIVTIIKARSEGIKKGDYPEAPLELIVRRIQKNGTYIEEIVVKIVKDEAISTEIIERKLKGKIIKLVQDNHNTEK